jgi:hypothetical protein
MNQQTDKALLALYRRASDQQPSALLDARVRRAAQQSVQNRPRYWAWGLSTAAVLVLSFSVVIQLVEAPMEQASGTADLYQTSPPQEAADTESPSVMSQQPPAARAKAQRLNAENLALESFSAMKKSQAPTVDRDFGAPIAGAGLSAPQHEERARLHAAPPASVDRLFEEEVGNVLLPSLPLSVDGIRQLDSTLDVSESSSGELDIHFEGSLIARLRKLDSGARIQAWRGAERLGLRFNWSRDSGLLQSCSNSGQPGGNNTDVHLECRVDGRIRVYSSMSTATPEYIEWIQPAWINSD